MALNKVTELGNFIRDQRTNARMSLRKLSNMAGISNPYLSQIERGLRRPSAEILQAIAKSLRISAETLYVKAGILEERAIEEVDVSAAILGDRSITEKQKQVLIEIYQSFRHENELEGSGPAGKVAKARATTPQRRGAPQGRTKTAAAKRRSTKTRSTAKSKTRSTAKSKTRSATRSNARAKQRTRARARTG